MLRGRDTIPRFCYRSLRLPLMQSHANSVEFILDTLKNIHQIRIEVLAPFGQDDTRAFFVRHGLFVAALAGERIVYVAQGQNARCEGNVSPARPSE